MSKSMPEKMNDITSLLDKVEQEKDLGTASEFLVRAFGKAGNDIMLQEYAVRHSLITLARVAQARPDVSFTLLTQTMPHYLRQAPEAVCLRFIGSAFTQLHTLLAHPARAGMGREIVEQLGFFAERHPNTKKHFVNEGLRHFIDMSRQDKEAADEFLLVAGIFSLGQEPEAQYLNGLQEHLPTLAKEDPSFAARAVRHLLTEAPVKEYLEDILRSALAILPIIAQKEPGRVIAIMEDLVFAVDKKSTAYKRFLIEEGAATAPLIAQHSGLAAVLFVRQLRQRADENPDHPGIYNEFTVTTRNPVTSRQTVIFSADEDGDHRVATEDVTLLSRQFNDIVRKDHTGSNDNDVHQREVSTFDEDWAIGAMHFSPRIGDVFYANMYDRRGVTARAYPVPDMETVIGIKKLRP